MNDSSIVANGLRPMAGRDPDERGRVATSLELLFDLTFAVSFGLAGAAFARLAASGEIATGLAGYAFACFAIIWAWINFTWFASAFDTDDWFYRLVTMLQMMGVIVLALGLPAFFNGLPEGRVDNLVMVLGYVVMRVAMLIQWGRAYRQCPWARPAARIYLITITVAQIGWTILALAHTSVPIFVLAGVGMLVVELLGPALAERTESADPAHPGRGTPWHPQHVAERYSALAIITLGEGVVGTVAALSSEVATGGGWDLQAVFVVTAGIGLTFGMWWSYFSVNWGDALRAHPERSFGFGYGHIALFAGIAGTGAGLQICGYVIAGDAPALGATTAVAMVAGAVLLFMTAMMLLYAALYRTFDAFHSGLLGACIVILLGAIGLARAGVPMGWCLLLCTLAPAVVVIGAETVGHRHQAELLARG